jgi:DNA invertase Pin-like site-specific DNA recombinase
MGTSPNAEIRVASYQRTSKDESNPERQGEAIAAWAARRGLAVRQTYVDRGGRRHEALDERKRPAFTRLLEAVRRREWDVVVVEELSRLGFKDQYQFMYFAYLFREHKTELREARTDRLLNSEDVGDFVVSGIGAVGSRREVVNTASRSLGEKIRMARAGEWWGGYIPYGLCVAALEADGTERWRVEDVGPRQRLRVFSNGLEERWDGEGAFPKDRRPGDRLVLRPSGFADRLEVIARIFEWADAERVACYRIAMRLNDLGIPHPRGPWHGIRVQRMLLNPAYVGLPSVNKNSFSRYARYQDGRVVEINGDGKHRQRNRDEWVTPDSPLFPPLVDPARFERVRERLLSGKAKRSPSHPGLWLSGLVYCGTGETDPATGRHRGCGHAMVGWARPRKRSRPLCYVCKTNRKLGSRLAPCGTGHKETDHDLLVAILDRWLEESGQLAETLVEHGEAGELLRPLFDRRHQLHDRLAGLRSQVEQILHQELATAFDFVDLGGGRRRFTIPRADEPDTVLELPGCANWSAVQDVFGAVDASRARRERGEREALEARLRAMVSAWSELPGERAKAIASDEIRGLESRLAALGSGGPSLSAQLRELQRELTALASLIVRARKELKGETRRRRAAIEGLVERIVVHHVHEPRCPGSDQVYARLDRVEIIPWQGEARTYDARGVDQNGSSMADRHATEQARWRASARPCGRGRVRAAGCACRARGGSGSHPPGSTARAGGSAGR